MLAMLVPWAFVFLANAVYADFHFLSCVSSGPSANPFSPSPAIAVPTSDLASCSGILGERMLVVENLTQPIGICETPREGSTTTQALIPSTVSASVSVSQTNVPNPSVHDIQSSPNSVGSTSAKSSQKTAIIVGTVLGVLSLCLAMATALLIWSRRRKAQKIRDPDDPPIQQFTEAAPVFQTIQQLPLATETSRSSAFSPKTPGPMSAVPYSPTVREELREAIREAVREAIPSRNARGASWDTTHTDVLPPSYYRGEAAS
ncbi:hypothetical protein B0H14DRAFT_3514412 [Mycena olivaceomarginata]|nr:hypothetical protein B0H14DRAFT_3514412 [Mycena olivaceomarginata]